MTDKYISYFWLTQRYNYLGPGGSTLHTSQVLGLRPFLHFFYWICLLVEKSDYLGTPFLNESFIYLFLNYSVLYLFKYLFFYC